MSTPDLAYIVFSIMTLALMACLIHISYLQHQNAELSSIVLEQDALFDEFDRRIQNSGECIRELSVLLKAASECANEYRAALRDIDNMLQTDPIQFLFTTEEIHHV